MTCSARRNPDSVGLSAGFAARGLPTSTGANLCLVGPAIHATSIHHGARHDSVSLTPIDPFNATAGRCKFKGLADASLVSRIHPTARCATFWAESSLTKLRTVPAAGLGDEIRRAKSVSEVAQTIVNTAR
jgi:hypothetical protein